MVRTYMIIHIIMYTIADMIILIMFIIKVNLRNVFYNFEFVHNSYKYLWGIIYITSYLDILKCN